MTTAIHFGSGWAPEPPSEKDFTHDHHEVRALLEPTGLLDKDEDRAPSSADLREWCSPVHFQGWYHTCQAHVVTGMLELLEQRAFDDHVPASRLFLYQVTRRLLQEEGDPGVYLRQMFGALVLLGVPPEKYWPYVDTKIHDDPRLDVQPDAFCFALAREFGAARYYRLDPKDRPAREVLRQIREHVAAGLPVSLGFPMYKDALTQAVSSGRIPYATGDELMGTHAVLVVGYDDDLRISNATQTEIETTGAFLIKNSWSTQWGEQGYGWIPYEYLLEGHAKDCWTMVQPKWIETGRFGLDLREVELRAAAPARGGTQPSRPSPAAD